jgi:hypothetical protein
MLKIEDGGGVFWAARFLYWMMDLTVGEIGEI